ncbi:MAG: acetyltransferase [Ignavibacteria bacterium]|nr:acetyltransferase [Ignavibacteria bacterium]
MKKKIIIVGGFHEVIELCEMCSYEIAGIIDNKLEGRYMGYNILGKDEDASAIKKEYKNIPIIVTPDSPQIRVKIVNFYLRLGYEFANIISPQAVISKSANLGKGIIVQSGVNISSGVVIDNFVRLNTKCNIMHDSVIGDYCTIAPNAVILGRVNVMKSCYIGANATVLPGLSIGEMSIIGAGSVVTKNVEKNSVIAGVPGKKIKENKNQI